MRENIAWIVFSLLIFGGLACAFDYFHEPHVPHLLWPSHEPPLHGWRGPDPAESNQKQSGDVPQPMVW